MIERGVQVYLVSHDYLFKINFFLNKHLVLLTSTSNYEILKSLDTKHESVSRRNPRSK